MVFITSTNLLRTHRRHHLLQTRPEAVYHNRTLSRSLDFPDIKNGSHCFQWPRRAIIADVAVHWMITAEIQTIVRESVSVGIRFVIVMVFLPIPMKESRVFEESEE